MSWNIYHNSFIIIIRHPKILPVFVLYPLGVVPVLLVKIERLLTRLTIVLQSKRKIII